jgi:hypothetical protein
MNMTRITRNESPKPFWTTGKKVIAGIITLIILSAGNSQNDTSASTTTRAQAQSYIESVEDNNDPKPMYNRMRPSGGINISQTYYKGAAKGDALLGFATLGLYDTYCDRPLPQGTWNTVDAVVRIEGMDKMLPISFTLQQEVLKKKGKKAFCSTVEETFARFLQATD